ncbi:MAG: cyclase [Chloroflexi bacterium]|nr:MAG: cyclase [Chloroflexota bacterium]
MYKPNPQSEFRVKFDFRVDFTNGGYVEGRHFLLDLEGDTVSEADLKVMLVESMNLAKAGEVKIFKKEIVRRGEHNDAYEQS